MCGIIGKFSGAQALPPSGDVRARLDLLRHRGPDSAGWYQDGHAALGFRRLSIIDVSGGDQPLFSTDRSAVLTLNGELYNHRALRQELSGRHHFRTRSDAEVLVHRYADKGLEGLLDGVNGMFAFSLYDRRKKQMILGRDRAGQKPLYWSIEGGVLQWASELKALLGDRRPPISRQAVSDYLRFGYVPAPLTMFSGIFKLPAGCILVCESDMSVRIERYWQLNYTPDDGQMPDEREHRHWKARLADGLSAAVERRLESEVPMGFLLSGGVDSAAIFALGARATEGAVRAFTIGFPGDAVDESQVAAQVARQWGARHDIHPVTSGDVDRLGDVLYLTEEPLSTDALLPTAQVFRAVSQAGITTVLTGEGSDEIMAGYRKFASACDWVKGANPWPKTGSPLDRYLASEEFSFPDPGARERLLGEVVDDSRFHSIEAEAAGLDPLSQMLHFEARLRLPDRINPRLDRLSMAWSIEARAPFMDFEFQELCAQIPHRLRRGVSTDKMLLRESVRDMLPDSVINSVKAPFRAPARWFVSPEELNRELSDDSVAAAGLVDVDAVRALRDGDGRGHRHQEELYSLHVLHAWHRCFVQEPNSVEEITSSMSQSITPSMSGVSPGVRSQRVSGPA
ncbi:MAG: asparagine synthase (glutamine-hydrolyzing) [Myxococcota bacterium]|jgi:asparagine synthase (glutamine-hydrolysing)